MIPKPGLLSELAEGQNRDLHRLQESSVGQNANSLISDVSGISSELQGARKSFVPEERKKHWEARYTYMWKTSRSLLRGRISHPGQFNNYQQLDS